MEPRETPRLPFDLDKEMYESCEKYGINYGIVGLWVYPVPFIVALSCFGYGYFADTSGIFCGSDPILLDGTSAAPYSIFATSVSASSGTLNISESLDSLGQYQTSTHILMIRDGKKSRKLMGCTVGPR